MRIPRRSILTLPLGLALLAASAAHSRPASDILVITGRVVEAEGGRPLEHAQVFVTGGRIGTLTDSDGGYRLPLPTAYLAAPFVRLHVQLIGYVPASTEVSLAGAVTGDTLSVDFRLESTAVALQELVVTGEAARSVRSDAIQPSTATAITNLPAPAGAAQRIRGSIDWNREQYAHIEENTFRSASDHPLSTFSIDVDRASYSNIRRFLLKERRLPPVDAVQIEEMVNYFTYDYPRPEGDHPVAVTAEVGAAPWAPGHRLLRVGLASRSIDRESMPPANLVFLLDVSGSMSSPDKLPLVQRSLRLLVDQLRPEDHVAIVVYAGAAGVVLEPTSGADRERILDAIDRLRAGGSTAGGEGLRLAYHVAKRHVRPGVNNRVILATDGDFNVGESSDAAMIRLVEQRRDEGTFLTVLGFGTGNLQNEKMQSIAQHGNGNYAYIDGLHEAKKVLVGEMGGTLLTVAKDVKVQIEFNPRRVRAYRLLGYENRLLAAEDFNDDTKDAGELGAGHTVTALYEIIPVGVESEHLPPAVDPLRYQDSDDRGASGRAEPGGGRGEMAFVKVRYKRPRGTESRLLEHPVHHGREAELSQDFHFAAAVAGFGMLLRESEHRGSITAEQVMHLARQGLGEDEGGYRRGFLDLVRAYEALEEGWPTGAGGSS